MIVQPIKYQQLKDLLLEKNDIIDQLVSRLDSQEKQLALLHDVSQQYTHGYLQVDLSELEDLGYVHSTLVDGQLLKILPINVTHMRSDQKVLYHRSSQLVGCADLIRPQVLNFQAPQSAGCSEGADPWAHNLLQLDETVKKLKEEVQRLTLDKKNLVNMKGTHLNHVESNCCSIQLDEAVKKNKPNEEESSVDRNTISSLDGVKGGVETENEVPSVKKVDNFTSSASLRMREEKIAQMRLQSLAKRTSLLAAKSSKNFLKSDKSKGSQKTIFIRK